MWIPFNNSFIWHFLFICLFLNKRFALNACTHSFTWFFSPIQKWDVSCRFHLPDCRILPLISRVSFLIWSNRTTVHYIWRLVDSCGLLWTLTASAFSRWTAVIAAFVPLNMSVRRENFPSCQDRSGLVDIVKLLLMLWSLCVSGCVNSYLLSWALGTLSVMLVCETWILLRGQAVWR